MSEQSPPPSRRSRLEPIGLGRTLRQSGLVIYGAVVAAMAAVAVYMRVVDGRDLTSPHVMAPAIGAVWFALRIFMILGTRKK